MSSERAARTKAKLNPIGAMAMRGQNHDGSLLQRIIKHCRTLEAAEGLAVKQTSAPLVSSPTTAGNGCSAPSA